MRHSFSVRGQIIALCTLFTIIFLLIAIFTVSSFTKDKLIETQVQSAAYNLNVITSLIETDLTNIDTLAKWVSINNSIKDAMLSGDKAAWVNAYDRIKDTIQNNPSFSILERLIITDNECNMIMQFGTALSESKPIDESLLEKELNFSYEGFCGIYYSTFYYSKLPIIKYKLPILDYNTGDVIGWVYASLFVNKLFKNLLSYEVPHNQYVEVSLCSNSYQLIGRELVENRSLLEQESISFIQSEPSIHISFKAESSVYHGVIVNLKHADLSVLQLIDTLSILTPQTSKILIFLLISMLILLLGIVMPLALNRIVYKPILRLKYRLNTIASEAFSYDESLDTNDEFGEIGRAINNLSAQVVSLMNKAVSDEKHKREIEYKMLQNQINPHFLYNTLNSIKWMATIQKADGISEMVTSLSRLMKVISKAEGDLVTLKDELEFIKDYLVIMKYRYGSTMQFAYFMDESALNIKIPRFLLQPLVENAIFHGLEPKGSGAVVLTTHILHDSVIIGVADNGIGFKKEQGSKVDRVFKHIGLKNTQERLSFITKHKGSLTIISKEKLYTICRIELPLSLDEVKDEL